MKKITALSFGAGVQSTAILLLIKHHPEVLKHFMGDIPTVAYFADTGSEMQSTYTHLEKCLEWTPIPIEIVSNGRALDSLENLHGISDITYIPWFTKNPDGTKGMLMRKCTSEFKVKPIRQALRKALGYEPKKHIPLDSVNLWLGISIEEASRQAINQDRWINNHYPLVELRWDRTKAAEFSKNLLGYYPSKSRCYHCPFIGDWNDIKTNHPEDFAKGIILDDLSRKLCKNDKNSGLRGEIFLHRSLKPLDEAVNDQISFWHDDDFSLECKGFCGT